MKLFQNPIVVGALALAAALLVFRNTILPLLKRNAPAKRQPAAKVTPPPAAAAEAPKPQAQSAATEAQPTNTTTNASAGKAEPRTRIALAQVGWKFNGSPPRDPFQLSGSLLPPERLAPPASEVLKLTAIWRQTGESLAVINGRILSRGDTIDGFRIERIEPNLVWVNGPAGREPLEFKPSSAARTNGGPRINATPATQGTTAKR